MQNARLDAEQVALQAEGDAPQEQGAENLPPQEQVAPTKAGPVVLSDLQAKVFVGNAPSMPFEKLSWLLDHLTRGNLVYSGCYDLLRILSAEQVRRQALAEKGEDTTSLAGSCDVGDAADYACHLPTSPYSARAKTKKKLRKPG